MFAHTLLNFYLMPVWRLCGYIVYRINFIAGFVEIRIDKI